MSLREKLSGDAFQYYADDAGEPQLAVSVEDAIQVVAEWLESEEAWADVGRAIDPLAFHEDAGVRHQHCSPTCVDAVQGEAFREGKRLTVTLSRTIRGE